MNILIKSVVGSNFMSYENLNMEFDTLSSYEFPCFIVTGENLDNTDHTITDKVGSNGTGKSSLFESICWGLYGKVSRRSEDRESIIRKTANTCTMTITFSKDNNTYEISRTKTRGKSEQVTILEGEHNITQSKILDSNLEIERILGMNFDNFCRLGFLFESNYSAFSGATDKQKKEMLEEMLPPSVMNMKDTVAKDYSRILMLENDYLSIDNIISYEMKSITSSRNNLITTLENNNNIIQQLKSKTGLTAEQADALIKEKENIVVDKEKIEDEYTDITNKIRNIHEEDQKLVNNRTVINNNILSIESKISSVKNIIKTENMELEKIGEFNENFVCPNCGKAYFPEEIEKFREKYLNNREKCVNSLKNANGEYIVLEKSLIEEKEKLDKIQHQISYLMSHLDDNPNNKDSFIFIRNNISKRIMDMTVRNKEIESLLSDMNLTKIIGIEGENSLLMSQIQELDDKENKLNNNIILLQPILLKINSLKNHFKFWVDFSGWRGIIAYYTDEILSDIESKANEFLLNICDNSSITISSYKENKGGTINNSITIDMHQGEEVRPYNMASTGERKKIDIAISLAIRDIYSERMGSTINVIVLDEIFNGLDSTAAINVMRYLPIKYKNINVFVINHNDAVNNSVIAGNGVLVQKKSGISTLKTWPGGQ